MSQVVSVGHEGGKEGDRILKWTGDNDTEKMAAWVSKMNLPYFIIFLRPALLMQLTGISLKNIYNLSCCSLGTFHREVREVGRKAWGAAIRNEPIISNQRL